MARPELGALKNKDWKYVPQKKFGRGLKNKMFAYGRFITVKRASDAHLK
jgi:hypothetical protein